MAAAFGGECHPISRTGEEEHQPEATMKTGLWNPEEAFLENFHTLWEELRLTGAESENTVLC